MLNCLVRRDKRPSFLIARGKGCLLLVVKGGQRGHFQFNVVVFASSFRSLKEAKRLSTLARCKWKPMKSTMMITSPSKMRFTVPSPIFLLFFSLTIRWRASGTVDGALSDAVKLRTLCVLPSDYSFRRWNFQWEDPSSPSSLSLWDLLDTF